MLAVMPTIPVYVTTRVTTRPSTDVKLADGSMKWVQSSKAKRVADLSHPDVQPVIADKVQYHFGQMLDAWFAANR